MSNSNNDWKSAKNVIYLPERKLHFEFNIKALLDKYPVKKEFTFVIKSK